MLHALSAPSVYHVPFFHESRRTARPGVGWRWIGLPAVVAAISCSPDALVNPQPAPDGSGVSASASTLTLSSDSVAVGRAVTVSVVPRDAGAKRIGPGLTVELTASGGSASGKLGPVSYFAWDSSYRATYTAQVPGTALTIRAMISGTPLSVVRSLTVRPASPPQFSFCSTTGAVCTFIGRRDVRLVASNGASYTQEFHGSVPCAPSGYERGFTGAPAAPYLRCEIGELKTQDVPNIMPGMAGLDAAILQIPLGDTGVDRELVRAGMLPGAPMGEGSFRMTCQLAKMGFFDPIVFPGAANSSHLHMFFGNVGVSPSSTAASVTTSGAGSCSGGTINRTGYWVPALFDVRTSEIIPPDFATIYYKTGYNVDPGTVREIPAGLVMIAGDKSTVGRRQVINQLEVASWGCQTTTRTNTGAVPDCPVGDVVTLAINFPQCWDGVRRDSPDHQSHMAYPDYRNPPERSTCPATHPVMLPIITEIFHWPVTAGMNSNFWRLTSDMYSLATRGGYSAHADWMNGWSPDYFRTIVTRCLQPGRDCGVDLLGDGRTLY